VGRDSQEDKRNGNDDTIEGTHWRDARTHSTSTDSDEGDPEWGVDAVENHVRFQASKSRKSTMWRGQDLVQSEDETFGSLESMSARMHHDQEKRLTTPVPQEALAPALTALFTPTPFIRRPILTIQMTTMTDVVMSVNQWA
jgi:hypothetical protein